MLQNQSDIQYLLKEGGTLNEFGIRVIGIVENASQLPDPATYTGEFGDAYAVGTASPYTFYIYTRQVSGQTGKFWFNIGLFPAPSTVPGPIGPQGIQGPQGTRGSTWQSQSGAPTTTNNNPNDQALDTVTGNVYQFVNGQWQYVGNIRGPQGIQGIQGIQGPQGIQGQTGPAGPAGPQGQFIQIADVLTSTDELPAPDTVPRTYAYVIPVNGANHVFAIVGTDTLVWQDIGGFGGGTQVIVGSNRPTEIDLSTVPRSYRYIDIIGDNITVMTFPPQMIISNARLGIVDFNGQPTALDVSSIYLALCSPVDGSIEWVKREGMGRAAMTPRISDTYTQAIDAKIAAAARKYITINAPSTSTSGQLTEEQLTTLQSDTQAYIQFNNEYYYPMDIQHTAGYLSYSHTGADDSQNITVKVLTVTINTRGWSIKSQRVISNPKLYCHYLTLSGNDGKTCFSLLQSTATPFTFATLKYYLLTQVFEDINLNLSTVYGNSIAGNNIGVNGRFTAITSSYFRITFTKNDKTEFTGDFTNVTDEVVTILS